MSDRKNVWILEETLEAKERYIRALEAAFDTSFFGICIADKEGNVVKINKAHTRITGMTPEDLVSKNFKYFEENGLISSSVTLKILKTKEPITLEQKMYNGKTYIAQGNPVFDEKGNVAFVVTALIDNSVKEELEKVKLDKEKYALQLKQLKTEMYKNDRIIYRSEKMKEVINLATRVGRFDSTVMITGESGVGKELIAQLIHDESNRVDKPFIKINCSAIPDNLLESELFGYEPGSFTGALRSGKTGILEYANGGTVLLDEIGDMPANLQVKLLRVLQEHEFQKIGGHETIPVDIRIIAATNANLSQMIKKGIFREDLFYRLNIIPIHSPSLKERKEDIPVLIEHFRNIFNEKYHVYRTMKSEVIEYLIEAPLPGNVRELKNIVERLVLLCEEEEISLRHVKKYMFLDQENEEGLEICSLKKILQQKEKEILQKYIHECRTTEKLAQMLGVSQPTISRKLKKYKIQY